MPTIFNASDTDSNVCCRCGRDIVAHHHRNLRCPPEALHSIKNFLASADNNAWLKEGSLRMYVRKGYHYVDGKGCMCFDVANVTNENAVTRGKGAFWRFLDALCSLLGNVNMRGEITHVYLENVHNRRLAKSLAERGFTSAGTRPPSYWWELKEESK